MALRGDRGITLPEVLVAMAILTIGLLGVAGTMALSTGGVVAGLAGGQAAVEHGYAMSTATLLAQARLEEVKRLMWTLVPAVDQIGGTPGPPPALPDEAAVPDYPAFAREVRVLDATPAANMKTVSVTVRYRYSGGRGLSQEALTLRTVVAVRP
jgi:prepilin-type N-terminal cleavage/methylation domain-containing protein